MAKCTGCGLSLFGRDCPHCPEYVTVICPRCGAENHIRNEAK